MQNYNTAISNDLVLIGGGHSHLFVLRHFAMHPLAGTRLTLVTRDLHTPYSGMLPGFIAGHYGYDDAHIDLLPLAQHANARLIHAEVSAIDADAGRILMPGRPPLEYDLLSINIGSRPGSSASFTPDETQFAAKPVDRFIAGWQRIEQRLQQDQSLLRLAIIGGGAGAVELALSLNYRAQQIPDRRGSLEICLLTDRERLLPSHNARVQTMFTEILGRRSIAVHYRHRVESFADGLLRGDFADPVAADVALWVTHASPAAWLQQSGLALDENGFIAVNASLQSLSHDQVFAAGDIAAVSGHPRPKSGVFAVRQGLPLAHNLARRSQRQPLKSFRPQKQFLSLISSGDRYAVASRGAWALRGKWCWWLKDRIDRAFMRRFTELPAMQPLDSGHEDLAPMRCGGCGSKLGSAVLERVLADIDAEYGLDIGAGLGQADDAALISVPPGKELVQSVDHFRSFIEDPYLFGRIATNHALGDLFAMGVDADSALVFASVVFASEATQAQDLYQLLAGVVVSLREQDARLVGGHSGEAEQMSCGLSVNGFARRQDLLRKSGMRAGERLILTKALGSGVLFAADMRARARGAWIEQALQQMLQSSRAASHCFRRHGATACTDVTGYGLAGHLFEMARASDCAVRILLEELPLYEGAAELAGHGILSSLHPQNLRIRHAIDDPRGLARQANYPLLFDPQTAGGLLASVPAENTDACLQELRRAGYSSARVIAEAVERSAQPQLLSLVNS